MRLGGARGVDQSSLAESLVGNARKLTRKAIWRALSINRGPVTFGVTGVHLLRGTNGSLWCDAWVHEKVNRGPGSAEM